MADKSDNFKNLINRVASNFAKQCEQAGSGSSSPKPSSSSPNSWKELMPKAQKAYDELYKQSSKQNDETLKEMKIADEQVTKKIKGVEDALKDRIKSEYEKLLGIPKTPENKVQSTLLLEQYKKILEDAFLVVSDPKTLVYKESMKYIKSFQSTANEDITVFYNEIMKRLDKEFSQAVQKMQLKYD